MRFKILKPFLFNNRVVDPVKTLRGLMSVSSDDIDGSLKVLVHEPKLGADENWVSKIEDTTISFLREEGKIVEISQEEFELEFDIFKLQNILIKENFMQLNGNKLDMLLQFVGNIGELTKKESKKKGTLSNFFFKN